MTVFIPSVIRNNTTCLLPTPETGDAAIELGTSDLNPLVLLKRAMCDHQQETSKNALIVLVSCLHTERKRKINTDSKF